MFRDRLGEYDTNKVEARYCPEQPKQLIRSTRGIEDVLIDLQGHGRANVTMVSVGYTENSGMVKVAQITVARPSPQAAQTGNWPPTPRSCHMRNRLG